jgi:hypothetical protein
MLAALPFTRTGELKDARRSGGPTFPVPVRVGTGTWKTREQLNMWCLEKRRRMTDGGIEIICSRLESEWAQEEIRGRRKWVDAEGRR